MRDQVNPSSPHSKRKLDWHGGGTILALLIDAAATRKFMVKIADA
jgi:hypothetical protein